MPGKSLRAGAALPTALLAFLFWASLPPPAAAAPEGALRLELRDADGRALFSRPVREGDVFGLRFRHSVALSPVEEWFRIEDGGIFLEKTVYQDFGAGLPHQPGPGQTMTQEGGRLIISGYHRRLPAFDVRVGRVAGHMLLLPGSRGMWRAVPLSRLSPPGSAVTFTLSAPAAPHFPSQTRERR